MAQTITYKGETYIIHKITPSLTGGFSGFFVAASKAPAGKSRPKLKGEGRERAVRCLNSGAVFPSIKAAASVIGLHPTYISNILAGKIKPNTWFFEYVS